MRPAFGRGAGSGLFGRRSRGGIAVFSLVVASLVLTTLDLQGGGAAAPGDALRRATRTLFEPVQSLFGSVFRPFVNVIDALANLGSLRSENEALRAEVDELRGERDTIDVLRTENEQLHALLCLALPNEFTRVTARVTAYGPNNYDSTVVIDAGQQEGVQEDNAVVSAAGLVGRVVAVQARSARVLLLSSPDSAVSVKVAGSEDAGVATGQGADRLLALQVIDARSAVEPGERLVTSGLDQQRSIFPPALTVGTIEDVTDSGSLALVQGTVRPEANLDSISLVQVLLWTSAADLPPASAAVPEGCAVESDDQPVPPSTLESTPVVAETSTT